MPATYLLRGQDTSIFARRLGAINSGLLHYNDYLRVLARERLNVSQDEFLHAAVRRFLDSMPRTAEGETAVWKTFGTWS